MNQPIEQRFANLEQRVDNLERLEQKLDFNQRDVSYKTDMAQGFLRQLYESYQEMKTDLHEFRMQTEKRMDSSESKLDLILQLLQPRQE